MALAKSQQSLKSWGDQKWRTSDGSESKGKKRYLPDAAWKSLSSSQKAATNRAKAKGNKEGKQFVSQPKSIKEKTSAYRKTGGEKSNTDNKMMPMYKKGGKSPSKKKSSFIEKSKELMFGGKPKMMKSAGFPDLNKDGKITFADVLKGRDVDMKKKKSGGLYTAAEKSENITRLSKMDPSAKKKNGGSRFEEMAAAGKAKKKGLGGMSDSTSSNDAGMEMMESEETNEVMDDKDKRARARRKAARIRKRKTNNLRKNIGKCNKGEVCLD